jgi:hypothetical protein
MQTYAKCEFCGEEAFVADYGPHNEFICIECSLKPEHNKRVAKEMVKRFGREQVAQWTEDALKNLEEEDDAPLGVRH